MGDWTYYFVVQRKPGMPGTGDSTYWRQVGGTRQVLVGREWQETIEKLPQDDGQRTLVIEEDAELVARTFHYWMKLGEWDRAPAEPLYTGPDGPVWRYFVTLDGPGRARLLYGEIREPLPGTRHLPHGLVGSQRFQLPGPGLRWQLDR